MLLIFLWRKALIEKFNPTVCRHQQHVPVQAPAKPSLCYTQIVPDSVHRAFLRTDLGLPLGIGHRRFISDLN